jgi:hypothetical protein
MNESQWRLVQSSGIRCQRHLLYRQSFPRLPTLYQFREKKQGYLPAFFVLAFLVLLFLAAVPLPADAVLA